MKWIILSGVTGMALNRSKITEHEKARCVYLITKMRIRNEDITNIQKEIRTCALELSAIQGNCSHENKVGDGTMTQCCADCGADPV
jgi:hypothetical protein